MDVEGAPSRLRALPSWLLGQVSVRARRVVGDVLAQEGVHRSQFALMASLDEFGPLSQTALSDRSGLDRSDVVRWVDDLAHAASSGALRTRPTVDATSSRSPTRAGVGWRSRPAAQRRPVRSVGATVR